MKMSKTCFQILNKCWIYIIKEAIASGIKRKGLTSGCVLRNSAQLCCWSGKGCLKNRQLWVYYYSSAQTLRLVTSSCLLKQILVSGGLGCHTSAQQKKKWGVVVYFEMVLWKFWVEEATGLIFFRKDGG